MDNLSEIFTSLILTFLSTFAYFFCCSVIIPIKQIGLKLITAIFIMSFVLSNFIENGGQINLAKLAYSTPLGLFIIKIYDMAGFIEGWSS
jgi:hypothetical protein